MKNLAKIPALLFVICALVVSAFGEETRRAAGGNTVIITREDGSQRIVYVLTEAQLRERMQRVHAHTDPGWFIHVPEADRVEASKARSWNATTEKTRQWAREHEEFGNWVRNRIAAGSKGRRDEPATFTLSPVEFLTLCIDPATKWDAALAKWANGAGPASQINKDLTGAINLVKLEKEPSAAARAFAEKCEDMQKAYASVLKGTATAGEIETVRSFIAAMK